jgi:uncharacterized protein (TIGR00369 family)
MNKVKKSDAPLSDNRCFGCGQANEHGLKLKFAIDREAGTSAATVRLARRWEGPPGHVHGGIIAVMLDEAMGKLNAIHGVVAMTRQMEIDFLRPCPLGEPLSVTGRVVRRDGRKIFMESEIHDAAGKLLVRQGTLHCDRCGDGVREAYEDAHQRGMSGGCGCSCCAQAASTLKLVN